jgi:hypothetical protein
LVPLERRGSMGSYSADPEAPDWRVSRREMAVAVFLPKPGLDRPPGEGGGVLYAVPRLHPEAGLQRVGRHLLAAGPGEFLHTFEDERGHVSEVAERIMELVDGRRAVADIVAVLCEEFEVEPGVCREDAIAFVRLLVEKRVLVLGP